MSQEETGTTDEDPNDYLDALDDIYGPWIRSTQMDPPADTVMAIVALTIEVRKARQAIEAIATRDEKQSRIAYSAALTQASDYADSLRDTVKEAARKADMLDRKIKEN